MNINKILHLLFFLLLNCTIWGQSFHYTKTDEGILLQEGDQKVLFYQTAPKSLDGRYERANYIHPLYGLEESVLTEDFPADHLHQRGIFWTWHQIIRDGRKVADGWDCAGIRWQVRRAVPRERGGRLQLKTDVRWQVVDSLTGDWTSIVRETAVITVHPRQHDARIIDFDIRLRPLEKDIRIGGSEDEKGYGGFSLRLALPPDLRFLDAAGREITPRNTAVDAGPWVHLQGSFGPGAQGVVIMPHPYYPHADPAWILRREKSMQNVAWPGRTPVRLRAHTRLRYRLVIYEGELPNARLVQWYAAFVH